MISTASSNPVAKPWRALLAWLATLSVLLVCAPCHARPAGSDSAIAEALFRQGKELMQQGDYAHACPKLAESKRLDPASGTCLALAMCYEKDGKTASAWTAYLEAASLAGKDGSAKRKRASEKRAAALEPKLSRLTIVVADEVQSLEGVRIQFDEVALARAVWGTEMPVDPGEHVVEATAEGKKPWTTRVTVGEAADRQTVEVKALEDAPVIAAADPSSTAVEPALQPGAADPSVRDTGPSDGQVAGYVVGAIGLVGLGLGTVFGLKAIDDVGEAQDRCSPEHCTDPVAIELNDDGRTAADVSTVALAVGGAAVVTGLILVLATGVDDDAESDAPAESAGSLQVSPVLGYRSAGLVVGGVW